MNEYQQLCQELYKLKPVWDEKHRIDWFIDGSVWDTTMQSDYETGGEDWQSPAYDLEYLLKKLPEEIGNTILVITNGERPHAGYAGRDNYGNYVLDEKFYQNAHYSGDVVCAVLKLAIQLVKERII